MRGLRFVEGSYDRHLVKEALGKLKGPLMKVAQMVATVPDLLPPEFAAELAELQTNAPPMGPGFVRRRMAAELGPDWQGRTQRRSHSDRAVSPSPECRNHASKCADRCRMD